ncbi:hypothetical protein [Agrobacterium pusense]|uniref:hypothetical protein n=1 Tax=Agrobacterium pusense TaxID=648995 RepID=UPI000D389A8D|nr:hypothetical protein [Agrobacterium pusense]PTV70249.1 hypothetical protein DBL06_25635 [Agrobacterium pusense]
MEDDTNPFDFDWEVQVDDEMRELEDYMLSKVTSVAENNILLRHAGDPTRDTADLLRGIAARYQRGDLGVLLPVLLPFTGGDQKAWPTDFFERLGEQSDDDVLHMYRQACRWADDLGFPLPKDAPPLDQYPMDHIEIGEPWPEMSSSAIH